VRFSRRIEIERVHGMGIVCETVVAAVSRRQAAALLAPQLRDDDPVAGHLVRDWAIARIDSVPFWLLVT
jgi:hypothetical protein